MEAWIMPATPSPEAVQAYLEALRIHEAEVREREEAEAAEAAHAYQAEVENIRHRGNVIRAVTFLVYLAIGFIWAAYDPEAAAGYFLVFGLFWLGICIFVVPIYRQAAEANLTPEGRHSLLVANMVGLVGLFRR
jgi:hypothetical protein